jgi:STAM-binding protein
MSQHQKSQGYFPSLNSMFIDTTDRYHGGSSVLFGSNANEGGHPAPYPGLPPSSAPIQPYSQQDSSTSYIRPPPLPPAAGNPPQSAPPIQTEAVRIPKPPDAIFDPNIPLKTVTLARECLPRFLAIARVNTEMNKETCGLLLGKDKGHKYSVTTLLIPKQHSTSDTCTMDEEELVLQFTEERSLITLGWVSHSLFYLYGKKSCIDLVVSPQIHTHPSQSCFMSSVDLHTHSGFQRMLPESFAVVCAPKSNPKYVFSIFNWSHH